MNLTLFTFCSVLLCVGVACVQTPQQRQKENRCTGWSWLAIIGLLPIGVATVFVDSPGQYFNRLTLHQIIFRLDSRYWPIHVGCFLWLICAWLIFDMLTHLKPATANTRKRRIAGAVKSAAHALFGIALLVLVIVAATEHPGLWKLFYQEIIVKWYFNPLSVWFADGTVTKQLIATPLTVFVAVLILISLRLLKYMKNRSNRHVPTDTPEQR